MHFKTIFRHILLVIISITAIYTGYSVADAPMPSLPGLGQGPSLEEIKAMESEIDNFVRGLPPEQQKQFYKDVEELTGIMEKMTPDELNEFVGSVFSEAGLMEKPAPQPAKPAPKPEPVKTKKEEVKPAVVITTAPSGPTEKAVNMITAIIKRTEEFMRKAQIIPELQSKMNKWVVQKKLLEVTANLDWEVVETQIDELNVLLYSLKEKDPVTDQYKHIGNLIKDEALYNNLATLQVTLEAYVPNIYVPAFGLETVSKESRAAIREVLSQYLESFYLLNVPAAIKKVKALYEPRAKELKEEEKHLAEQAKMYVEQPRASAPAVRSPGTIPPYTPAPYTPPSRYDYTPAPSYTPTPYTPHSYTPTTATPGKTLSAAGGGAAGGKAGAAPKAEKGGVAPSKEGEKEGIAGGEKVAGAPDSGAAPTAAKDTALETKFYRLTAKIDDSTEILKEFKDDFKKFNTHFYADDFKEDDATLKTRVKAIEETNKALKKSTADIKKFKDDLKTANQATQDSYKKSLSSSLSDTVKFYQALYDDIGKIMVAASYPDRASHFKRNKYYIYFGKGTPSDAVQKEIPKVTVTMDELYKTIGDFIKEAK